MSSPMFELVHARVDQVTGAVDLQVKFDIGNGEKTEARGYENRDQASKFLAEIKRDFILVIFDKYVNHSRILMENGSKECYQIPVKLASLDRLIKANHYFQGITLPQICSYLLVLQKDLNNVMPCQSNSSYSSSQDKLKCILDFAISNLPKLSKPKPTN